MMAFTDSDNKKSLISDKSLMWFFTQDKFVVGWGIMGIEPLKYHLCLCLSWVFLLRAGQTLQRNTDEEIIKRTAHQPVSQPHQLFRFADSAVTWAVFHADLTGGSQKPKKEHRQLALPPYFFALFIIYSPSPTLAVRNPPKALLAINGAFVSPAKARKDDAKTSPPS